MFKFGPTAVAAIGSAAKTKKVLAIIVQMNREAV